MKRRILAMTPARRTLAALAVGISVAALSSGCQVASPVQTDVPYVPADGVQATIGKLAVRDLVLVGDGSGTAVVSGSAVNLGDERLTMQLTAQPAAGATDAPTGSEVELGPRQQVNLATQGLQLTSVTSKPGTLVPMKVTSSVGGTQIVNVPMLAADGFYSTVTPAPTGS